MRKYPRLAQSYIFSSLRYKVTSYAIAKIEKEWADLSDIIKTGLHLGDCQCELLLQFGLPCKHYLLRAYQMGDPIPRSLLHPRWWLNGPLICRTNWKPEYPYEELGTEAEEQEFGDRDFQEHTTKLSQIRRELDPEERHRFDAQITQAHKNTLNNLVNIGRRNLELQLLPLGQPDPVSRHRIIPKKTHGKAGVRGLTTVEIARRKDSSSNIIPTTPPRQISPYLYPPMLQHKPQTPQHPRSRQSSSSEVISEHIPPASTALAVAQYADISPEPAPNRLRTAPGRHPILGGGIGGLRQLGADLRYDPSGLALA